MDNRDKIILAVDVSGEQELAALFSQFKGHIKTVKIGKQLFTRYGPDVVRKALDNGYDVFLDLKYHDIPNTVKHAVIEAANLNVSMLTVHTTGGKNMLQAAVEAAHAATSTRRPMILGVTVLTSISQKILNNQTGIPGTVTHCVTRLAQLAKDAGLDGVIASPQEIVPIKQSCGEFFTVVTPGIRPVWAQKGDQERVMTPSEAVSAGTDYLVIGRSITAEPDPVDAFYRIVEEIEKE